MENTTAPVSLARLKEANEMAEILSMMYQGYLARTPGHVDIMPMKALCNSTRVLVCPDVEQRIDRIKLAMRSLAKA